MNEHIRHRKTRWHQVIKLENSSQKGVRNSPRLTRFTEQWREEFVSVLKENESHTPEISPSPLGEVLERNRQQKAVFNFLTYSHTGSETTYTSLLEMT